MKRFRVCSLGFLTMAFLLILSCACIPGALAQEAMTATPTIESALANLRMRAIGPAIMGGRIEDIAADPTNPEVIHIGAAAGGVWKTTDGGTTWTSLFDYQPSPSIGALAVAPSNPPIVCGLEFLAWLLERNIQPHIPVIDRRHQTHGRFTREQFRYEPAENAYYCPEGKPLRYQSAP